MKTQMKLCNNVTNISVVMHFGQRFLSEVWDDCEVFTFVLSCCIFLIEIWLRFTSCVAGKDTRTSLISSVNIIFLCSYFLLGLETFLRKLSTRLESTILMSKLFPISWILMKMYVYVIACGI